jgi:hypothetical protein
VGSSSVPQKKKMNANLLQTFTKATDQIENDVTKQVLEMGVDD